MCLGFYRHFWLEVMTHLHHRNTEGAPQNDAVEKVTAFKYGHSWYLIVKFPGVYKTSSSRVAAKYTPFQQKGNGRCSLSVFEGSTIGHYPLPCWFTRGYDVGPLTHMSCAFAPVNCKLSNSEKMNSIMFI